MSDPNDLFDDEDDFDRLLDDFIAQELENIEIEQNEIKELVDNKKPHPSSILDDLSLEKNLFQEERALFDAYKNFITAITTMAEQEDIKLKEFAVKPEMLYSRYKPKLGGAFTKDVLLGWEVMLKAHPVRLQSINAGVSDEELLSFAEKTTDETLQMAVVSYIEILLEIEACEIAYNLRKVKYKKRQIEKKMYEEHMKRRERIQKYIDLIKAQHFPIDAERLVVNYFKTAKKDPDGAYKVLTTNPAVFAPIEISKLKPRFFGMIKPKPEDGIRINREIGKFLKDLKT